MTRVLRRALVDSGIGYDGEPSVITKVVFSAAIAVAAAVGAATPAGADPNVFRVLSCSCQDSGGAVADQTDLGIHSGLAYQTPRANGGPILRLSR